MKAAELFNRLYTVFWACNITWFITGSPFVPFQRVVTWFQLTVVSFVFFVLLLFFFFQGKVAFFKHLKIYKEQLRSDKHFWFPFQRICHCAGSDCIKICIYTLLFVDFVLSKITNISLFLVFFLSNLVFLLPLAREIPRMGNANSMTTNCCF